MKPNNFSAGGRCQTHLRALMPSFHFSLQAKSMYIEALCVCSADSMDLFQGKKKKMEPRPRAPIKYPLARWVSRCEFTDVGRQADGRLGTLGFICWLTSSAQLQFVHCAPPRALCAGADPGTSLAAIWVLHLRVAYRPELWEVSGSRNLPRCFLVL